jgi:hypothetical protein
MAKHLFKRAVLMVESLESRQLLSSTAVMAAPMLPAAHVGAPAPTSMPVHYSTPTAGTTSAVGAWVYNPNTGSWSNLVKGPSGSTLTIVAKNGDITQTVVLFDAGDGDNTITTDTTWHKASGLVTRKTTNVDGDCDETTTTTTEAWKPIVNATKSGWQYSLNGSGFTDVSSNPPPPPPPSTGGH